jgi:hypothetical protein
MGKGMYSVAAQRERAETRDAHVVVMLPMRDHD